MMNKLLLIGVNSFQIILYPNINLSSIPIIRCDKCGVIPMISYDLNKNEVKIFCPNEKKETKISIEDFFGSLEKLKKINMSKIQTLKQK